MEKCRLDGELRTFLDGELPAEASTAVQSHLQHCSACRTKVARLEADRAGLDERLATLAPRPEAMPSSAVALARLNDQMKNKASGKERLLKMFNTSNRQMRPVFIALALVVLVAVSLAFEPVRAVAGDLLSVFRVQKFAVLPINMEQVERVAEIGDLLSQSFFLEAPKFLENPEIETVDTLDKAGEIAGYAIRTPDYIPTGFAPAEGIELVRGGAGQVEVDLEMARAMFEMLELDPTLLPDSLGEQPLEVVVPTAVSQFWNWQVDNRAAMSLLQSPSPEVGFPDDVDTTALAKAVMQLTGMDETEAERLSQEIDWTNTLVIPAPADIVSFVEVEIDGTIGLLFTLAYDEHGTHSGLMWQTDNIIYFLQGNVSSETIMDVAQSIQ